MEKGQNWDKTNTIDMIRHRAFFSMAATDKGMFAFGGVFSRSLSTSKRLILYKQKYSDHDNFIQVTTITKDFSTTSSSLT